MRKIFYLAVIATLLLQACSTGSNFSRKRYGHLRWINHDAKVEMPSKEKESTANDNTARQEAVQEHNAPVDAPATVQTNTPAIQETAPASHARVENRTATTTDAAPGLTDEQGYTGNESILSETPAGETFSGAEENQEKIEAPVKPMMDDDVKLIVCIILAIIIPPLGMYLWDGQADVWFILDLILFIVSFAAFYWFFGLGLAWLAAIVIALLRVFDQL